MVKVLLVCLVVLIVCALSQKPDKSYIRQMLTRTDTKPDLGLPLVYELIQREEKTSATLGEFNNNRENYLMDGQLIDPDDIRLLKDDDGVQKRQDWNNYANCETCCNYRCVCPSN